MKYKVFNSSRKSAFVLLGALSLIFFAADAEAETRRWTGSAGTTEWDDAANWSPEGVPAQGDEVIISDTAEVSLTNVTAKLSSFTLTGNNVKLTMGEAVRAAPERCVTVLRADNVDILNGALVTHVINEQTSEDFKVDGEWRLDGRINIECVNLTVDASSSITAKGKGYYTRSNSDNNGPGGCNGGASHGGFGGLAYCHYQTRATFGGSYGDMERPQYPGSSSNHGDNYNSAIYAGGVIKITASGIITVEGTVTADAGGVGGSSRHGCSGGSVWLMCHAIKGSGSISANGSRNSGNPSQNNVGAGGRIALHYDVEAQTALDTENGGIPRLKFSVASPIQENANDLNVHPISDIGTVWCTDARFYGEEYNKDCGVSAGEINAGDWSNWNPSKLNIVDAWIRIPSKLLVGRSFGSINIEGKYSQLDLGGEEPYVYCHNGLGYGSSNYASFPNPRRAYNSKERPKVTVAGNLTMDNHARLRLGTKATNETETAEWTELRVKGDIELGEWSWIETSCDPTNGAACRIWANNLTVAGTAGIRSDARGFGGFDNKDGKKRGFGPGATEYGASHGGAAKWTLPYGDYRMPVLPGSGGKRGDYLYNNGSAGGGVVWITLEGNCILDGGLQANAGGSLGGSSSTGSGGSVLLVCTNGTLSGSGYIEANGGKSQHTYGTNVHGAGGRIAVHYNRELQAKIPPPSISVSAKESDKNGQFAKRNLVDFGTFYAPDTALLEGVFAPLPQKRAVQIYLDDWDGFGSGALIVSNLQARLANPPQSLEIKGDVKIYVGALEFGGDAYNELHRMFRYTSGRRGVDVKICGDLEMFGEPKSGYTNTSYICHYGGITNGNTGLISSKYDKANKDVIVSGSLAVAGNVRLNENTMIYPYSHPYDGGTAKLLFKNLDISRGAEINANAGGWSSGRQGFGDNGGKGPGRGVKNGAPASYGGFGGRKNYSSDVYGCEKLPTLPGSGAGAGYRNDESTGNGGGLIYLEVSRSFNLSGSLVANGDYGDGSTWACGGSGGGIYVSAKSMTVAESAVISANGGNGNSHDGYTGGGGRIAIYTDHCAINENTIAVTPTVDPGSSAKNKVADPGTIYYGARPSEGFMLIIK